MIEILGFVPSPFLLAELAEVPLIRLDFSCNKITVIPVCYRNLRHLQVITLDNNPLQSPPAQVSMGEVCRRQLLLAVGKLKEVLCISLCLSSIHSLNKGDERKILMFLKAFSSHYFGVCVCVCVYAHQRLTVGVFLSHSPPYWVCLVLETKSLTEFGVQ